MILLLLISSNKVCLYLFNVDGLLKFDFFYTYFLEAILETFFSFIFLINLSFVHKGTFNLRASAIKSISFSNSFSVLIIFNAIFKKFEYSSIEINSTLIASSFLISINSFSLIFVFCIISFLYLFISSIANSGAKSSKSCRREILLNTEFFQNKVNNTFESTTNFILNPFSLKPRIYLFFQLFEV